MSSMPKNSLVRDAAFLLVDLALRHSKPALLLVDLACVTGTLPAYWSRGQQLGPLIGAAQRRRGVSVQRGTYYAHVMHIMMMPNVYQQKKSQQKKN